VGDSASSTALTAAICAARRQLRVLIQASSGLLADGAAAHLKQLRFDQAT
jgi:hypothetical protein